MKVQIESSVRDHKNLVGVNAFVSGLVAAKSEENVHELSKYFHEHPEPSIEGLVWGCGHNHFWLSEKEHAARILFVDFTNQN